MRADEAAQRQARSDPAGALGASSASGASSVAQVLEAGYRALFEEHFHATVRLARLLGADDPEDVAQEAFTRLHEHRRRLREPAAALAYVRRTVTNLTTSRLRHLKVVRRSPTSRPVHHASAEDSVVQAERVDALLAAVRRLPQRQREVLILRYWMDLAVAEVADVLDIPTGTAKSHISRAQRALATRLEDLA
ncbi:SigE family RNA polymerase sigma factor [Kineococcus gypseus]|uniref:sigma-70 family RNA polymerase sigma factor n=1 Tax=Kineococcus gypseus TaxID=1637102 RepID=UPI003D7EBE85